MPLPEAILNKPSLIPGLELYYRAFWDLMADRQSGMGGTGMIQYTAVSLWLSDHLITDLDDRDRFKIILNYLDMTYLNHVRGKEKK